MRNQPVASTAWREQDVSDRKARVLLSTLTLALLLSLAGPVQGQSASIGADVFSRYVWRGTDLGESMAVQPALTFGFGALEVGAWGSYSVSASGAGANENDIWATYTVTAPNGASFSFGFTDYYFPGPGAEGFFVTDAHTLELSASFTGLESFPISLYAGRMSRNDPDNSLYLEASVPVSAFEEVDLSLTAGMVAGESDFYGTEGTAFVNLGITASKDLVITEDFAVPMSVSYIVNANRLEDDGQMDHEHDHGPDPDRAFLVFGFSLSP